VICRVDYVTTQDYVTTYTNTLDYVTAHTT